jgi:hypothetical protein
MFTSVSQASQDLFVYKILGKNPNGTFMDLGCQDPIRINNTWALEKFCGWKGVCIDIQDYSQKFREDRSATFLQLDLLQDDWFDKFTSNCPFDWTQPIDYLSFDIDDATLGVLPKFPFDKLKFKLMTVEHDSYVRGEITRLEIARILTSHGYLPVCTNVSWGGDGWPFEDWWYNPELIEESQIAGFRGDGLDCSVITGGPLAFKPPSNGAVPPALPFWRPPESKTK